MSGKAVELSSAAQFASPPFVTTDTQKLVLTIAGGIVLAYAAALVSIFAAGIRVIDPKGYPVVEDFVAFWAAGHAVLKGAAVAAYDAHAQHAAEVAVVGHGFRNTLGWSYPPVFLFAAAALACLPYKTAFLSWCAVTCAFYAGTVAVIAKNRIAFVVACAAPVTLAALVPGQNGFLTAGLIGSALLHIEKRPVVAGLLLGLLSYKPQFGILFPLALTAGRYWRAFGWAAVGAILWNGLAAALFGFGTIGAFLHAMSGAAGNHLVLAGIGWNKLQSVYGLARAAGFAGQAAWTAQALFSIVLGAIIVWCWRSRLPFALKAAALAAAVPLATPYVFVYDLPVLAVAAAFLFRDRSFDRIEQSLLVAAAPCVYLFLWVPLPSAFFASLAVAAIAARRCYLGVSRSRIKPSCATEATSLPSSE